MTKLNLSSKSIVKTKSNTKKVVSHKKREKVIEPTLNHGDYFKVTRMDKDLLNIRDTSIMKEDDIIHINHRYLFRLKDVRQIQNPQFRLRKNRVYRVLYTYEHPCGGKTIFLTCPNKEYFLFSLYYDKESGYRQQSHIVCQKLWLRKVN
jgi:hypothetical protein